MSDTKTDVRQAKALVLDYFKTLSGATPATVGKTLQGVMGEDVRWHGPHPVNTLDGLGALLTGFWKPFLTSFKSLAVRPYIVMGGEDGGDIWVSATGDLIATFAADYLALPATGSSVRIRFGSFYRFGEGRVAEVYTLLDLPELAAQAGRPLLPPGLGRALWIPGPLAGDGLVWEADSRASQDSLNLVERMIAGLNSYDTHDTASMGMARFWHAETMRWYGPHGVGTTVGLADFERHHQLPFLHAFPDRHGDGTTARFADGLFVAYNGWPAIRATHAGDYLGVRASKKPVTMRCLDWWRRDGDKLLENWVMLDLPDLFAQVGVNLLNREVAA